MSKLKPFESLEDFEKWREGGGNNRRRCPVCVTPRNAMHCSHAIYEMRAALKQELQLCASAQAGEAPTEVRVVSETGGEKGQKLERFDLIPFDVLAALARLYGRGALKYADDNYRRGYSWRLSIGALFRHVTKWLRGESYDTRDGLRGGPIDVDANGKPVHMGEHHLVCAMWHCATLIIFESHKLGTDDRAACVDL